MLSSGDIVDLQDSIFGWRGQYTVIGMSPDGKLVKIKNCGTGSQQFASPDKLRKSRLSQFFIKSLQGKK